MSDCIFCKMIEKKMPCKIEHEDDDLIAIRDIHPQAPAHLLVIPKKHVASVSDLKETDRDLIGQVLIGAKNIAQKKGWKHYRLVLNNGEEAGQSVFHIHCHLLSGRPMLWPPG
ncbi:MAG: histidine triad nucleotide-binding protein [Candidatus Omnitrophica bacterium]|nr:histidine triad nucleotide-binding protein [Candidatus Omnitrophota bacterium]